MSTTGKVLVVFVVLAAVVWLVLAAGVAQLNYNGNKALADLSKQLEDVQANLENTQRDIASLHDQTSSAQEDLDRQLTTFRAQIAELENGRSQIVETLTRLKYQKDIVDGTVEAAKSQAEHRNAEHQAEEKAMADLRHEVQELKTHNGQLLARLLALRNEFQKTDHNNRELVKKKR